MTKPISRQRAWQLAKAAKGLCQKCGAKRLTYKTLCDDCAKKHRDSMRRSRGMNPWRPGGPGRPPIDREAHQTAGANGEK